MGRKLFRGMRVLTVVAVLFVASYGTVAADDDEEGKFEVTVTNLTRGQIISPSVVVTHTRKLAPLFTLGSEASPELAAMAEDANSDPLMKALDLEGYKVKDVQTIFGKEGPIMPGESASVVVYTSRRSRNLTVIGMLVTTNDAFFALNGVRGPRYGSETYYSAAYDAGSEANNEKCEFIPGPPCKNPFARDTDGAEGYVHIHAGIHGVATLVPAEHDWRNPVAKVTITRLR